MKCGGEVPVGLVSHPAHQLDIPRLLLMYAVYLNCAAVFHVTNSRQKKKKLFLVTLR